jgi:hypothetical protein
MGVLVLRGEKFLDTKTTHMALDGGRKMRWGQRVIDRRATRDILEKLLGLFPTQWVSGFPLSTNS